MPGPTSEGSIVAYIGANDGDFQEAMRRATAAAEELNHTDPTVTVHANTSEAMAKLAAFRAELAAAKDESDPLNMAGLPTSAIRPDGSIKAADWVAAKQAQAAANAAAADAGAGVKAPTPAPAATSGGGGGIGYAAGWAIGIAAALPLIADLVGAAAAGSGALMGMGAAGVLAVKGIKDEMASGSAEGRTYSTVMQTITGDLGDLASTSAAGVLQGVSAAVGVIHSEMPSLNSEIDGFSHGLGTIAAFTVDGLASGFKTLNPLFTEAEAGIQGMASDWDRWVHNGGLLQWGNDVQRVFPLVTDTLGTTGSAIVRTIGDLQPLGTATLGALDGVAHVANFLAGLGPLFPELAIGATTGYLAFRNFETIAPILDRVTGGVWNLSGAQKAATVTAEGLAAGERGVEAAAGPAGWVVLAASAAVGLLAGALAQGATSAGSAATAMQDYTAAVQQDNGVVGENVQKIIAQNLATSGAIDKAKQLGISTAQLTAAVAQGGPVLDDLKSRLEATVTAHSHLVTGIRYSKLEMDSEATTAKGLSAIIAGQANQIQLTEAAYRQQVSAMGSLALQAQSQITQQGQLQLNFGLTAAQIANASTEQQALASTTSWVNTQLALVTAGAQAYGNELTLMNNGSLSVAIAHTQQASALLNLTDSLKKNGVTLDDNTQKGIANQQAIEQSIQAAQTMAKAVQSQTGSTMQANKSLADSKAAMEAALQAQGLLTPAIKTYIDTIKFVPTSVTTTMHADTSQAMAAISALVSRISGAQASFGPLANGYVTAPGSVQHRASGGPIYAASGMFVPQGTDTVAAMLTPGEMVIRRKSADYDPQFIRQYNDDPERALDSVRQGRGTTVVQHFHIQGVSQTDPNVLGAIVGNRARSAMSGVPNWGR